MIEIDPAKPIYNFIREARLVTSKEDRLFVEQFFFVWSSPFLLSLESHEWT